MAKPNHTPTVTRLTVENFMRVKTVDIRPSETGLVELHGANAQGKSSVLRAMWSALGGKSESPKDPVQHGKESAKARVELGDLVVERTWRPDGTSRLEVFNKDGATYRTPQKILDSLVSKVAFDPVGFMRLDAKRQADILRQVAGVDTTEAELEVARVFDKRRDQNAVVRNLEARLGDEPELPDAIDTTSVVDQLEEHRRQREQLDLARDTVQAGQQDINRLTGNLEELKLQLLKLNNTISETEGELEVAHDGQVKAQHAAEELEKSVVQTDNTNELRDQLATADVVNAKRQQHQVWVDEQATLEHEKVNAKGFDNMLGDARQALADLVQEAEYPVDGLTVTSEGVHFNDVPLEQASSAEQLRVSMAMAMATKPDLKVVHIKEGSLLDTSGLELVQAMALEKEYQVWVEVVDDQGLRGLVIEDGELKTNE
jgi:energy-coupling factor transporter ATP-binding protein EcfA2